MRRLPVLPLLVILIASAHAHQAADIPETKIDTIFARWTRETPGCAVGVARGGKTILQKAYGMANLEHDVPNTPDTIFEAGSVSKQFTAAALLLLAQDGKLSLDDAARKYVPELPDYGAPLTIRHMLHHTSGLRDWGEIAGIGGWPRGSRVHTHSHVLDIVSRQRALNFPSGSQWSYSNTGYNLAAVIVSRVSGKSFAEFTGERIFVPLGMTKTSWRDDHTRIVKGRAIAYSQGTTGTRISMPFENVHGNGGLLTTVGDLLKWNENFDVPKVGDGAFLKIQQEPGTLSDGKPHTYAMGLRVAKYRGVPEVSHSGSTAGYRAHLMRYPQQGVSVAVLCNSSSGDATEYATRVAELHLGDALGPAEAPRGRPRPPDPFKADPKDLASYPGRYYSDEAEVAYEVVHEGETVRMNRRPDVRIRLQPIGRDEFDSPAGRIRFIRSAAGQVTEMSLRGSRVFDLRFRRQDPSGTLKPER